MMPCLKSIGARCCMVLVLCVAAIASGGCATVRRAREVQAGDHLRPGEKTLTAKEAGLASNAVLSVERALELALKHNPAVFQATMGMESARAQLKQARAGWMPTADGSASYGRSTSNNGSAPANNDASGSYSASVQLNYLLFDFGKTPANVRQALASALAAEETLRGARSDTAFAVRSAFYGLCQAKELKEVADNAVRQYMEHEEQAKLFAEVGRRTRYDVTKAEVDLGNARLSLVAAINTISDAQAKLNGTLGLAENPGYDVAAPGAVEFRADLSNLMVLARERLPDMRVMRARVQMASAAVDAQIADLYPQIALSGRFGGSGASLPLVWNWSGALQAAMSLFSGGRSVAAIDKSVADLGVARADLAAREQRLCVELSQAVNQLESAKKRLELTELTMQFARESLEIVKERYKAGGASAVDVTDAQVALTTTEGDQVKARYDWLAAIAQIHHNIGDE